MTYTTVNDADAYFSARGNDEWPQLSQSEKQAAIVRASQYLDALYVFEVDVTPPPERLQHATAELALMSTEKPLTQPDEAPIKEAEVAGAVSVTFAVDKVESAGSDMQWAYINGLLYGIAHRRGTQTGLGMRLVT